MKLLRREILKILGLGAAGFGLGDRTMGTALAEAAKGTEHVAAMKGTVNFKGFTAKEITPNEEFYITSYSDNVPAISSGRFRLRVDGLVERPLSLSMKELDGMLDMKEYVTLECIGNPVGGSAIGNALWEGVSLKKIIDMAGPRAGIIKTAFHAEDGYSDSIPYNLSLAPYVFLAWRMNGEPLPARHGYPLRVIVPGIYGMKNVKWLSRIELVNYDFKGYWEKQGWSDEAVIPIKSQILMPMEGKTIPLAPYVLGGVAFAGRYGIRRVQVSWDGEKTWHDAELKQPLSPWAWTLWRYDWKPPKEGSYTLSVRGVDREGRLQESAGIIRSLLGTTFPAGAKGYHSVEVKVRKTS
ncbi:MAG: molybdopterin-dependent oxidoreductase [Thermodesulfovibrionales bacterium]|jgi:DMSO/TMAO reductase YedYZ molybdopterin-dependent catalytic subunit